MTLDLRNNTITVGELLDNRASRSVFQRRFGKFMNHPLVGASRSLTLAQLAEMAAVWLPQRTIQETIQQARPLCVWPLSGGHLLQPGARRFRP